MRIPKPFYVEPGGWTVAELNDPETLDREPELQPGWYYCWPTGSEVLGPFDSKQDALDDFAAMVEFGPSGLEG
jgi:hypothetical protein